MADLSTDFGGGRHVHAYGQALGEVREEGGGSPRFAKEVGREAAVVEVSELTEGTD